MHSILKSNYNFSSEKLPLFLFFSNTYDAINGEPDLELYTISIIRLNTAFQKLDSNQKEALEMIKESSDDLNELYLDIIEDLNQDEINLGDYYLFFENGKTVFPMYLESLKELDIEDESINQLMNILKNLDKIAQAFRD